jgi:hypothetical protein
MQARIVPLLRSVILAGLLGALAISCGGSDDGGGLTAPADVKAMPVAGPAVHVTWKDTATEHHFSIERKEGTGAFKEIGTELLNITAHHDATVEPGKTYTYRLASVAASGEKSAFSAEATATVP